MPEFSVVIPSFNHARYISGAVKSVLNQSYKDLELIVIDDGSTDETLSILENVKDPRMKVLSQENQGAHVAINRGLQLAEGQYLAILNSDDQFHRKRLENTLRVFKNTPDVGLVGSYIEIIDEKGNRIGMKEGYKNCEPWLLDNPELSFRVDGNLEEILLTENHFSTTSNFVFSRDAYETTGNFLPLRYLHDWDFALRLSRKYSIQVLPEYLVRYRVHPHNTIKENQASMIFEICWILAMHLPEFLSKQAGKPDLNDYLRSINRLLYSIYTYNNDRVLNGLLLQDLQGNPTIALQLLDPANQYRQLYTDYIARNLTDAAENASNSHHSDLGDQEIELSVKTQPQQEYLYRKIIRRIRRHLRPLKAAYYRFIERIQ